MSLIPSVYSSTDPGAPALTGQAGSMTNLLDSILVDGYGSGGAARAPLGWTREFTATNKRVYMNNVGEGGSGHYLRIDDSAAIGNARFALATFFEHMTDIDTGDRPIPTLAQRASGIQMLKSSALSAVQNAWWAIGNSRCFYMFADLGAGSFGRVEPPFFAGDFLTRLPADTSNIMLSADGTAGTLWAGAAWEDKASLFRADNICGYVARGNNRSPGAVAANHSQADIWGYNSGAGAVYGRTGLAYPDVVGGGLVVRPATIIVENGLRGFLPGVLSPQHLRPYADKFETGFLADIGHSLIAKNFHAANITGSASYGQVLFIVDEPWE